MVKKFSKKDNFHPGFVFEYFKLKAFFENDPTIKVGELDNENQCCDIVTDDEKKARILDQALKCKYLKVRVLYDGSDEISEADIDYLCKDNALYKGMLQMEGGNIKALMFAPVVVPVYTDNFFSPTGYDAYLPTTLAQDLLGDFNCQTEFRSDDCYCEFACDDDECCDSCCDESCDECDVKDCPLDDEKCICEIDACEFLDAIVDAFKEVIDKLDEE